MAVPHKSDPPIQWAAAASCGKLVAQGLVEIRDIVQALIDAAKEDAWQGDLSGLQARLTWQVTDTADHWCRVRDRTEYLIRNALGPLIEARAAGADILAAAHAVNEQQDEPFTSREVWRLVNEILEEAMARIDRMAKQRGRRNAR